MSRKPPSVSTPSQSIKSSLMRWARASTSEVSGFTWLLVARRFVPSPPATAGGFGHLSHFKVFDRVQLPASAHARQNIDGAARMLGAQLLRVKRYVQGQVICVELLAAQHVRLPAFGLGAHRAPNKLYQLTRHTQGRDSRLPATANRGVELIDESFRRRINSRWRGRLSAEARGACGHRRTIFGIRPHRFIDIFSGFRRLVAAQRNFTEANRRPRN